MCKEHGAVFSVVNGVELGRDGVVCRDHVGHAVGRLLGVVSDALHLSHRLQVKDLQVVPLGRELVNAAPQEELELQGDLGVDTAGKIAWVAEHVFGILPL